VDDVQTNAEIGAAVEADPRAEFVRGLRELADLVESDLRVPVPDWATAHRSSYVGPRMTRDQLVEACFALDAEAKVVGSDVVAWREFAGGVELKVSARAQDICVEREVTKTEFTLPAELDPAPVSVPVDRAAAEDDPRGAADNGRELTVTDTTERGW
jgi:hypothetical protein